MNIVKKPKTPAQDRLKSLMTKNKVIDVSIKKEIEAICNEAKTHQSPVARVKSKASTTVESPSKSLNSVPKTEVKVSVRTTNTASDSSRLNQTAAKHKQYRLSVTSNKQNKITKTKCSKHKTPAQQRLADLQKTLIKEQIIKKNASEKLTECSNTNNKLHEHNESKDLTDSVFDAGVIDEDIELSLIQNRKFFLSIWTIDEGVR